MAKRVLKDCYVSIDSNLIHGYCSKLALKIEVDEQEVTTFGSLGWKEVLGGIQSGGLDLDLKQDAAAAALDAIMFPLIGTVVPFEVRISQASVGTSNPKFTGNVLIKEWTPISGGVGDVAEVSVSFPTSGAVTRATS
ncbi:phage tail tube protein [Actinoplanes oblitus]|uniref:Phage tail tube protein n=1 Tax=Actinoplanes oblitus TaxID=3040509 RepID=A0ABY8WIS1_9ACTN|nr:phage tail tube protein [Actinoplanes oblitus]WIM97705.1 phage tail tube protein [Actinoplanes oblitus]